MRSQTSFVFLWRITDLFAAQQGWHSAEVAFKIDLQGQDEQFIKSDWRLLNLSQNNINEHVVQRHWNTTHDKCQA